MLRPRTALTIFADSGEKQPSLAAAKAFGSQLNTKCQPLAHVHIFDVDIPSTLTLQKRRVAVCWGHMAGKRTPLKKRRADVSRPVSLDSSMRAQAYAFIQRKIASGQFPAGAAVSELGIAKELGASRTPVREAIGQLVAEGLLAQSPGRGSVVASLSRQDIVELYELREALEVFAAGKAAESSISKASLDRLGRLKDETLKLKEELDQSKKATLDVDQMHHFMTCDLGFHTMLMRLASNARLLKVVNDSRLLIRIFAIRQAGHDSLKLTQIHAEHSAIFQAVADGKREEAMTAVARHVRSSQRERLDDFDYWEGQSYLRDAVPAFLERPR